MHPNRQSLRIPGYDYRQPGHYFITVCTDHNRCLFGRVDNFEVQLSLIGTLADKCLRELERRFPHVRLDTHVVIPNHINAILEIRETRNRTVDKPNRQLPQDPPLNGPSTGSLGAVVRSFKSQSSREINSMVTDVGRIIWTRNYYEHVIRTEKALLRIRQYIIDNPAKWHLDHLNPAFQRRA